MGQGLWRHEQKLAQHNLLAQSGGQKQQGSYIDGLV